MSAKYTGQGLAHITSGQLGMLPKLWALNQETLAKSGDIFGCTSGSGAIGILQCTGWLTVGYPDLNPNTIAEGISLYSVCLW